MIKENIIEQYLSSGKNLFPLRIKSKKPTADSKDWVKKKFDIGSIKQHKGNLGWAISKKHLVIDVDPKNGGDKSFEKLIEYVQKFDRFFSINPSVITPSGGNHYYFDLPESYYGKDLRKTLKEYPGIDFLSYGAYCVIAGSYIDEDNRKGSYTFYDDICEEILDQTVPSCILKLLVYNEDKNDQNSLGDFEGLIGGKSSNWSVEKVDRLLGKLDPGMDHDSWVKVGMGLHNWDPLLGFDTWKEWSQQSDKYDEKVIEAKWKSFSVGGGVSLGTLNYMYKEVVFGEEQDKISAYLERIKYADERTIHFDIISKIKNEDFDKINREKIVKALQDRIKEITGVKAPIGAIRQLIVKQDENGKYVDEEQPDWCKNWIYINSHASFINIPTMHMHKSESFNIENGIYVPFSEGGTKPSASKYIADKGFIKKVDSIAYLPTYEGLICNIEGTTMINTFNKKTIPIEASEYTKEGLEAIKNMTDHFRFLTGTEENYNIFMQWMAHQIQYPGRQILWSVVIQSIQGVGKSYCGEVLRLCLGDKNVGVVSPSQAVSQFNSWATGTCVNIMEELRVAGNNRYECVNSLKPLITDRIIMINEKGVKQYMTYNHTNYIIFTNHKDAIPLDEDDRRFWVIFVNIESLSEIEAITGRPKEIYFPELFTKTRDYSEEIRKFFLEYEITKDFMKLKQAPMTEYKSMMINTEEANHHGLSELREMIKEGGYMYNKIVISSSDLFEAFLFRYPEISLTNREKGMLLKKLGYSLLPECMKFDGKTKKLWAKKPLDRREIRTLLIGGGEYLDDI